MYKLIGIYHGNKETIDTAETKKEAVALLEEYKIAFGSEWSIYIKRGCK